MHKIIRAQTFEQLQSAARISAVAWESDYAAFVPQGPEIAKLRTSEEFIAKRTQEWVDQTLDGAHVWLGVETQSRQPVGVAYAMAARDDDAPRALELGWLVVRPVAQGTGLADALIRTAISDVPAYLWTLKGNERAIRFYRRHGFELDGVEKVRHEMVEGLAGIEPPIELRLVR